MSAKKNIFDPPSGADVRALVRAQPFAWVTSGAAEGFHSTLLPILPADASTGAPTLLAGHFPRNNPHVAQLRRDPQAWLLFLGPHSYVSPSWLRDRQQAPTWNYASVHFRVDIEFFDDADKLEAHLRDLVEAMEGSRPGAWRVDEMGARYALLASRVIGFRAHVRETRAKFKLGQNERSDVYADMLAGLQRAGHDELVEWMVGSNPGRGQPAG